MNQVSQALLVLALVLVSVLAAPAPSPSIPELHRREDGHVVSDSSEESGESLPRFPQDPLGSSQSSESAESGELVKSDGAAEKPVSDHSEVGRFRPNQEEVAVAGMNSIESHENDTTERVVAGLSWEHRYKQGVVPAKLPAHEKDNGYRYRHSIVHGYGDDTHA